jgi:hypothetical protein
MIFVSETPIYNDWEPIQIGASVSIIEAKYVKFNPVTFREEVLDSDVRHFREGTLLSKEVISFAKYYCVKLQCSHEIISFQEEPRKYFFKKEDVESRKIDNTHTAINVNQS